MSTISEAFRAAGFRSTQERLREIAMQALLKHPVDPIRRRSAIVDGIGGDTALVWLLFEKYLADATDRLVASVRNDMLINQRTGRGPGEAHERSVRAQPLAGGDRGFLEVRVPHVPAGHADTRDHSSCGIRDLAVAGVGAQTGDRAPTAARSWPVPGAGAQTGDREGLVARSHAVPGAGAQAVAAVVRLSLLDTFRINGQPLGDVTPAEARLWAEARGRQARRDARFIELITAGLPDGMPIRRYRRDEEAQAAFTQALQEAR